MAQKSGFKMLRLYEVESGKRVYGIFENVNGTWRMIEKGSQKEMSVSLRSYRAKETEYAAAREASKDREPLAERVDVYHDDEKGWIAEAVAAGSIVKWGGGFGSADQATAWARDNRLAPRAFIYSARGDYRGALDLS